MNHNLNADAELLDSILAHHLNLHLPRMAPVPTDATSPNILADNNHAYTEGAEDKPVPDDSSFSDTGDALYHLLMHYVDLLESSGHGGWTLDEETAVRTAVAALSSSGWTPPLSHDISPEVLTPLRALLVS